MLNYFNCWYLSNYCFKVSILNEHFGVITYKCNGWYFNCFRFELKNGNFSFSIPKWDSNPKMKYLEAINIKRSSTFEIFHVNVASNYVVCGPCIPTVSQKYHHLNCSDCHVPAHERYHVCKNFFGNSDINRTCDINRGITVEYWSEIDVETGVK